MRLPDRPAGGIGIKNPSRRLNIAVCRPFNGRELIPCRETNPTTEDTDEPPEAVEAVVKPVVI